MPQGNPTLQPPPHATNFDKGQQTAPLQIEEVYTALIYALYFVLSPQQCMVSLQMEIAELKQGTQRAFQSIHSVLIPTVLINPFPCGA